MNNLPLNFSPPQFTCKIYARILP